MQGILPVLGGLILWFLGGWSLWLDYDVATQNDYTMWTVPGIHWQIGGVFVIVFISSLLGAMPVSCTCGSPSPPSSRAGRSPGPRPRWSAERVGAGSSLRHPSATGYYAQ